MPHRVLIVAAVMMAFASAAPSGGVARHIEERFLAPCCWSESVAFHNSSAAKEMRGEIERFVAAGKTEAEIVDYYAGRYGERVLREPRGRSWLWLTFAPVVAALIGCLWLAGYVARSRRTGTAQAVAAYLPAAIVNEEELEW